ncbi:MAG: putative lipid II flippase FtsW [Gammaproteobacteria bacterium]|nr:MAG: putative lipid II flippase FtsW [Gammaproteobacteria bacterium]
MDFFASSQAKRVDDVQGRFDTSLLVAAAALAAFGVVMVASSSIATADGQHLGPFHFVIRHLIFLGLGIGLGTMVVRTELDWFERNAFGLLLIAIVLLLLVFVPGLGARINGARRWIKLGIASFQSVEAVKLMFIVYLASYLVRHQESVQSDLFGVVKPIGVAGVLIVLLVTVGMVWLGGARMRNLIYLSLPLLPAIAWIATTSDYRVKRLTSFLNPWEHPFDDGFQLTQALIAIGRGEWLGVGLGGSVQKLFYLPEAHTDFILAVIGEEFGFVGIIGVLAVFAWLVGRALMLGMKAVEQRQNFAGYCAFGIGLCIGLQALVSIGVNMGVLPTKGLTLPLVSSGGSSVMMTCVMVAFLLRISFEVSRVEYERAAEREVVQPRDLLMAANKLIPGSSQRAESAASPDSPTTDLTLSRQVRDRGVLPRGVAA